MCFGIRLEQQNRQFCHAKGGIKTKCRKYWVWIKSMHLDEQSVCRGGGGSSRTRPFTDWQPCMMDPAWHAHTHHDSGLETAAVDWAHEPTFQKQPLSCHNRPPTVAGPQHIARCCPELATTASPVGKRALFWAAAVKMQAGTSAGCLLVLLGRWFLFVSFPSPGSDSLLLENPRAQGALVPCPPCVRYCHLKR